VIDRDGRLRNAAVVRAHRLEHEHVHRDLVGLVGGRDELDGDLVSRIEDRSIDRDGDLRAVQLERVGAGRHELGDLLGTGGQPVERRREDEEGCDPEREQSDVPHVALSYKCGTAPDAAGIIGLAVVWPPGRAGCWWGATWRFAAAPLLAGGMAAGARAVGRGTFHRRRGASPIVSG
jgi:hypothetical protein